MTGRKIRDAADARACLAAVARSGGDRLGWAQANGVDGRSLHLWERNFQRCEVYADDEEVAPIRLVELVAEPEPVASTARYTLRVGPVVIEVDGSFDAASLRRLLAVVSSC